MSDIIQIYLGEYGGGGPECTCVFVCTLPLELGVLNVNASVSPVPINTTALTTGPVSEKMFPIDFLDK
jgi:hypothetical protein